MIENSQSTEWGGLPALDNCQTSICASRWLSNEQWVWPIRQLGTLLQLSHPKYEFWAAKNVTCLPFSLLFSGHLYKNHSAETWGLGCLFLDYSQPGYLCGLLPTDHPLRPGSHQWTHSTALSLFRWPEQLILSKMNRWVFFFESHAMLAHQTNRSRFYYPKSVRKMRH